MALAMQQKYGSRKVKMSDKNDGTMSNKTFFQLIVGFFVLLPFVLWLLDNHDGDYLWLYLVELVVMCAVVRVDSISL